MDNLDRTIEDLKEAGHNLDTLMTLATKMVDHELRSKKAIFENILKQVK